MAWVAIDLTRVSEEPPDAIWQAGFDAGCRGEWRVCGQRDPWEQQRWDAGYDEGLGIFAAEG
jgi:hypothetical protein